MRVNEEYMLAYHRVVTALSCEMNELLTRSTHHSGKGSIREMFPRERMAQLIVPIYSPLLSLRYNVFLGFGVRPMRSFIYFFCFDIGVNGS